MRQRLLAEARGNPLALLELPVALNVGTHPASSTLPDTLPLTRRLLTVFAGRVRDLPDPNTFSDPVHRARGVIDLLDTARASPKSPAATPSTCPNPRRSPT